MILLAGIDIGGTKCAVSLGQADASHIEIVAKDKFPTPPSPQEAIDRFLESLSRLLADHAPAQPLQAVGISCGGPLDSRRGLILSPPNLPGWDRIDIVEPLKSRFGVPVGLQNDANACAMAEWTWGAGRGTSNMVFLTFGTGMGAGLILNGRLYTGTNDMAGEVGHMRMEPEGPVGYGKAGSFEGFCSGGGIVQLARRSAKEAFARQVHPLFCPAEERLEAITAQAVAEAARQGDPTALDVMRTVGVQLGRGLALLIDILNPERIVIGSIYARQQDQLEPLVLQELEREALSMSRQVCSIVPSGLGELVGDYASLSIAWSLRNLSNSEIG